jgi:cytoskeleton protein RodZ
VNSKPSEQNSEGRAQTGGDATGGTLGQQLRRAREQRGVTLREISDQTRISMRYLEAIEADDYKHLPGGIFNKSFIKAYARIVRFNEQAALDAYARTASEHGETPDEVATSPTRSRIYMDGETNRSPLVTALLSALILGILILGVYAALHWYRRTDANNTGAANARPAQSNVSVVANNKQNAAQPSGTSPAAPVGLQVQIKAKDEPVWLQARVDEQSAPDFTLAANQTREFKPQNRLSIRYSKSKLDALEVTINGQVAQTRHRSAAPFLELKIYADQRSYRRPDIRRRAPRP